MTKVHQEAGYNTEYFLENPLVVGRDQDRPEVSNWKPYFLQEGIHKTPQKLSVQRLMHHSPNWFVTEKKSCSIPDNISFWFIGPRFKIWHALYKSWPLDGRQPCGHGTKEGPKGQCDFPHWIKSDIRVDVERSTSSAKLCLIVGGNCSAFKLWKIPRDVTSNSK